MTDVIAELMRANLFELLNQRDSMLRRAAIERINPKTSARPTTASLSGTTRWTLKPLSCKRCSAIFGSWLRDLRSQTLGLGLLAFQFVKPNSDNTTHVSGFDVALVRDGVIVELYTILAGQS
jgi:hypothetical protein